ncbi:hypothetical protein BFJ68_g7379 [Fusarium oxysporum]|uniref:Uracil catabolism protein 4 n=1 Tax=Fusarium oxysporum TaxID=5507 RepID=A0A420R7J1_FUSOX|nr:hypothetical protein BFJ68_g7379 [Fusarium oxysporum]
MGLFSRKDKTPKGDQAINTSQSNVSVNSHSSSLRSPAPGANRNPLNRTSATSTSPGGPMSPVKLPKIDLPRPPDPQLDPAGYLRSLGAVRERSKIVTDKALRNELKHFDVDMGKFPDVRDYDAPFLSIPGHGRYQHFAVGGRDRIAQLLSTWPTNVDNTERCRRLIDLFLVSVLLDAGAGTSWQYKSNENGRVYRRSEGIAVASLEMFKTVDKDGLKNLTVEKLAAGLQSKPGNEMAGIQGRTDLLIRLGEALAAKDDFWGFEGRPGCLIASSMLIVPLPVLWNVLMTGLAPIWPANRTAINGVSLGDAWPCQAMPQPGASPKVSAFPNSSNAAAWESILPFHKLTQWLTYSLMQPMQQLLKMHFAGTELLTGLPEYRNGGLFVDMGVLNLRKDDLERGLQNYNEWVQRTGAKGVEVAPMFEPSDDVIVEWRGVTVGFLDMLCVEVNKALKPELGGNELTLAQLLEAGSWRGGREIAEINRPNTKEPPILIESDGTVF